MVEVCRQQILYGRALAFRKLGATSIYVLLIAGELGLEEENMISTKEHVTMATVGGLVGAAIGAGVGGAVFGLPGLLTAAILGGLGGALFGSYM